MNVSGMEFVPPGKYALVNSTVFTALCNRYKHLCFDILFKQSNCRISSCFLFRFEKNIGLFYDHVKPVAILHFVCCITIWLDSKMHNSNLIIPVLFMSCIRCKTVISGRFNDSMNREFKSVFMFLKCDNTSALRELMSVSPADIITNL